VETVMNGRVSGTISDGIQNINRIAWSSWLLMMFVILPDQGLCAVYLLLPSKHEVFVVCVWGAVECGMMSLMIAMNSKLGALSALLVIVYWVLLTYCTRKRLP
jgi:hypothetical protein